MAVAEFREAYWCRSPCHGSGWPAKFASLLTWGDLNGLLAQDTFDVSRRLQLLRSGKVIDASVYSEARHLEGRSRVRIMPKELSSELRSGATAFLIDMNGLHPPLNDLAATLERYFGVPVGINAYAAWRTYHGFDVHRDDHEVFILQVSGRKRWLLYQNHTSLSEGSAPPEPQWERVLTDGDLLYIPRGCWHAAVPLDEPSLHLTISVSNPSVTDLVVWIGEKLRANEFDQLRLSRLADSTERGKFLDQVKNTVLAALGPEALDQYFRSRDSERRTPPRFSLPWSATKEGLPPDGATLVAIAGRRPPTIILDSAQRVLQVAIGNKTWSLPPAMKVVLEALNDRGVASVDELVDLSRHALDERMARAFVGTLIKEGIAFVVPSDTKS